MAAKKTDKRNEAFAGAIGRHISAKNIKREDFASRLGVSRITLRNWQLRPEVVSLGHLRILAREAQMTDAEILQIVRG